jgi:spore coat polysaccharide biosynthesis predicted glycosyltransferase SpsG
MVLFYNGKPDIRGVGGLLYEAKWTNYGTKIYRVNTTLSAEALEALIIDELSLTKSDFLVSPTAIDPRIY